MTAWTTNPIDIPDTSLTGYGFRDFTWYRDQGALDSELPQGVFVTRMRGSFTASASADTAGLVQLTVGISSYFSLDLGKISAGESISADFDLLVHEHSENPSYGPLGEWDAVLTIEARPDLGTGSRVDIALSNISVHYDVTDVAPGPDPENCFWTDLLMAAQVCGNENAG